MTRGTILRAAWLALALASAAAQAGQQVTVGASVTVQVSDRDKTAAAVVERAESLGGYFSLLNNDAVTLKVPTERSRELIDFIKTSWKPVDESYRADDVGASLDEIRASLKAKEELLKELEKLLASADASGILEIEAAGARLIGEIETLKGRIRATQHRIDFATVMVNFKLIARERPRDQLASPFPWLNGIGLNRLLSEFER